MAHDGRREGLGFGVGLGLGLGLGSGLGLGLANHDTNPIHYPNPNQVSDGWVSLTLHLPGEAPATVHPQSSGAPVPCP